MIGGLIWGGSPALSAELKIGFVDAQKVLEDSKAGKAARTKLDQFIQERQKVIDQEEGELKKLEERISTQASVLSADAKKQLQDELQRRQQAYMQKAGDLNREVQSKRFELLQEFNKGLDQTVKSLAEKNGYSFVFARDTEAGFLIYAKESFDLTSKVIGELDKQTP